MVPQPKAAGTLRVPEGIPLHLDQRTQLAALGGEGAAKPVPSCPVQLTHEEVFKMRSSLAAFIGGVFFWLCFPKLRGRHVKPFCIDR